MSVTVLNSVKIWKYYYYVYIKLKTLLFCCRNQPEIINLLLKHGADINVINKGLCSALHVAVNKQHLQCAKVLLKFQPNVNVQV